MRVCTVCSDPRVAEVDAALIGTEPYRSVAKRFNVSPGSVFRHQKKHLPATLLKAKDAGDLRGALAAVRELVRIVDLVAKLTGQIGGDQGAPGGATRSSITINFPVMSQADLEAVNNAQTIDLPPMARRLLQRPSDGHQR